MLLDLEFTRMFSCCCVVLEKTFVGGEGVMVFGFFAGGVVAAEGGDSSVQFSSVQAALF